MVEPDGRLGPPVTGLPAIDAGGQGGLLDGITDAGFAANRRIADVQLLFKLSAPFEGKVVRGNKLLEGGGERIRDVRQGPDGLLYVLTDSPRGRLLRLQPGCSPADAGPASIEWALLQTTVSSRVRTI